MARTTSLSGEALIKKWEGFFSRRYLDPVGVPTIGYGTIQNKKLGIYITRGMTVTKDEATQLMRKELRWAEKFVLKKIKVPLKQHQFDAIMSFVYNLGVGNFSRSTLLKKLNRGDYEGAAEQFSRWVWATDRRMKRRVKLRGLVNRRRDEAKMFRGESVARVPDAKVIPLPKQDIHCEHEKLTEKLPTPDVPEIIKRPETVGVGVGAGALAYADQLFADPFIAFAAGVIITGLTIGTYLYFRERS